MNIIGRRVAVNIEGTRYVGVVRKVEAVYISLGNAGFTVTSMADITLLCATAGCPNPADGSGIFCSVCWDDPGETA